MSEVCDRCGKTFFVLSKREQRDVDACKEDTDKNLCDNCRKRHHERKRAAVITEAMASTEGGRQLLDMMTVISSAVGPKRFF